MISSRVAATASPSMSACTTCALAAGSRPADAATDAQRPARHHGDLAGKSRGSHADSLFGEAPATFVIEGHQLAIEPPAARRRSPDSSRRSSHWKSIALREGPQLPQGELAAATGFGYQNAGPYALRSRRLTGFLSAPPATRAGAADCLGAFIGGHRPSIRVAGARAKRRLIEHRRSGLAVDHASHRRRKERSRRSAVSVQVGRLRFSISVGLPISLSNQTLGQSAIRLYGDTIQIYCLVCRCDSN